MDPLLIVVLVVAAVLIATGTYFFLVRRRTGPTAEASPDGTLTTDSALRTRLSKTRSALSVSLAGVFASTEVADEQYQELEEALISADVGPATAARLVGRVRSKRPRSGSEARSELVDELESMFEGRDRSLHIDGSPALIIVVGVNGTGKTTSIAKIASGLVGDGRSVVLAAADTFRAAADVQLRQWGDRVGVRVVSAEEGADPASVAHDAVRIARQDDTDIVIVDTAGRLHNQKNLMEELQKVVRVLEREVTIVGEVLLVLDGTIGQNGIAQARAFTEAVGVTGVVLTKLDGTSRGGIAIAVEEELDIPIKFIGIGEGMHDLIPFVPNDFVEALLAP